MNVHVPQRQAFRPKNLLHLGIALSVLLALFAGISLPVKAASSSQPVISILNVEPGSGVEVEISNLPVDDTFAVTMSAPGNEGISGATVAHFNTGPGGTKDYWFETLTDVSADSTVDIRIDDHNGEVAWTAFENTKSLAGTSGATASASASSSSAASGAGYLQVVHVEQGGTVTVNLIGLPKDTDFTVSIGMPGVKGNGEVVAGFNIENENSTAASFEIPFDFRYAESLTVTLSAPGFVYRTSFDNTATY